MILALFALLACQLVGEGLARVLVLPVPGPVLGMALMLGFLAVYRRVPEALESTVRGLLGNLSLLFVPAGVGVMVHGPRIQDDAWPLVAALVGSTILSIVVGGVVFRAVARRLPPTVQAQP